MKKVFHLSLMIFICGFLIYSCGTGVGPANENMKDSSATMKGDTNTVAVAKGMQMSAANAVAITGQLNVLYYDITAHRDTFIRFLRKIVKNKGSIVLHAYHNTMSQLTYGMWSSNGIYHQNFDKRDPRILQVAGPIGTDISTFPFYMGDQDFDSTQIKNLIGILNRDTTINFIEFYPNFEPSGQDEHLFYYIQTDSVAPEKESLKNLTIKDIPENVQKFTGSTPTGIKSDPSPPANAR